MEEEYIGLAKGVIETRWAGVLKGSLVDYPQRIL